MLQKVTNKIFLGGFYSLPSINVGGLGNASHNFVVNPINNGINPVSNHPPGQHVNSSKLTPFSFQPPMNFQSVKTEGGLPNQQGQATGSNGANTNQPAQALQQPAPPQQQQQGGVKQPSGPGTPMSAYRPLNVKDALSYLDQVKVQFQNRPDVYNHFLDIMKDFKSQSIDTPGVIDRVSTLFRGHPSLIQGFNTFLPPGYRIECSLDPSDPNPIRVTTPMGTTTRQETNSNIVFEQQRWQSHSSPTGIPHVAPGQAPAPGLIPSQAAPGQQPQGGNPPGAQIQSQPTHSQIPTQNDPYGHFNPQEQSSLSQLQAAANRNNSIGGQAGVDRKSGGPVEFNHAISYVNKIKTRFANQPDIYKHFLEILQTYQREQKPIAEVYGQVTVLFQNAPDLLDDFKQFLPDTNGNAAGGLLGSQPQGEYYPQQVPQQQPQPQLPPVGSFSPPTAGKVKKIEVTNDQLQNYEASKNREIPTSSMRGSISAAPRRRLADETTPTLVPGVPEPSIPPHKTSNLIEEIGFFDKVKKAIGSKQSYNDFLKIVNIYNQELIDKDTLIERVEGFIGSHIDLFDWFKGFVGYDDKPLHIENITHKKHQLDLMLCKPYGPSYRKLPKAETYMPCSGRDEMCWEVLNDEWVGHPTWASEDSGFIAHRKNQYEEILFRIEEERHEYDYYMEANLRTIQTLETIANRISNMTPEEKASFKLPNGLGHTSQTIYKKVIRKVYNKDRGFEVIDALHENPSIAIPVVLKRLKQKDEEWRRTHREWNKVWREMEQKVYFKSLDHLGLTFKQADKKLLTTKQLVSEISTIKSEQTNKRLHPLTPKPQKQLDYDFFDNEVLFDITKLVYVFLNAGSSYSANDKEKLYDFFKSFISLFFSIDSNEVEQALQKRITQSTEQSQNYEHNANHEPSSAESSAPESDSNRKRHRETDLLKDVLLKSKQSKTRADETPESSVSPSHDSAATSNVESETESKAGDEDVNVDFDSAVSDTWVQTSVPDQGKTEAVNDKRNLFNLFGNTNIYVFFRHLRVLYDRLLEVKNINEEVTKDITSRSEVQFAKDLNLVSNQLEDMGLQFAKADAYTQLLGFAERVIEGDVEHQWFEESLRQAYRNRAYKLYTVDKVTQALVKHLHTVVSDSRTSDIMLLFANDRKSPVTSAKDQILYRNNVRSHMNSEENMFRIEFDQEKHHVSIQYLALDDLTLTDQKNDEEKWNYYLTSYIIAHPTEGINTSELRLPFMKSLISDDDDDALEGYTDSHMKVKITRENYKLFFEQGSYDEFARYSVFNHPIKAKSKNTDVLSKAIDDKLIEEVGQDSFDKNKGILDALVEGPEKYKEFVKSRKEADEKAKEEEKAKADVDVDQTIENPDETTAEVKKPVNPAIASVKESDVTVDADSTLPQDDTELKGNDTTTEEAPAAEENATTEEKKDADSTDIIEEESEKKVANGEQDKEKESTDKDGDTKMED
ncbi:Transcriptional regulatory protein [Wickerhamomyces ciferrii]|uniref:Transcriptional regulatory protein n=1 Tax=Wickerhamomyces ciferrii (strain ATCC 14091 / BCRC 22168 / CBS 111 / JCM 3599 / NBRC 0793 / NRRL Y-1031 F-60-10) TaxID=1206466 RepID=K0KG56_WICCF|nr:Transcriptional regulatory protein [Wickerhamomyces ciferrii]CCH41931.1 Transcriptional regulatory protein [Wickerhamomyces ciferrii]